MGPVASLVRNLKYQDQTYLAKGLAGFIVAQLLKLDWPFPDLIIPVPMAWVRLMDRGFNQSALIAHYVSINLERPMQELLIRKNGDYSQAGLSRLQRTRLDSSSFSLKQGAEIKDKTILIIDDVMTTGTTIHHCANALAEGLPKNIYGLTVCKA
jgi:ComF family protein